MFGILSFLIGVIAPISGVFSSMLFGILSLLTGIIASLIGYTLYTDYREAEKINIKYLLLFVLFVVLSIYFHHLDDSPVLKGDIFNRYS